GSGLYNEHGNWEGVYAMAFQDSHFKPMYTAGYSWKAIWRPAGDVRLGLGYTAGLMSRTDIFGYVPFPIVLPVASVAYKNFNLETTFVPGGQGNGNIFFIWAKWELGKPGEAIGTPARPVAPAVTAVASANAPFRAAQGGIGQRVPYGPVVEKGANAGAGAEREAAGGGRVGTPSGATSSSSLPEAGSRALDPTHPDTVYLSSQRMTGTAETEFIAEGDVELRKVGTQLNAERLTYWPIDDEVEAEGSVRLEQGGDVIAGPKMRLKLADQIGFFEQPEYVLKRAPKTASQSAAQTVYADTYADLRRTDPALTTAFAAPEGFDGGRANVVASATVPSTRQATQAHGVAERIDFEGENQIQLTNATYSTCAPGNDDWYAKTSSMHLDYDREVGEGDDGTVYFKGVPIFYTPWLSFSLNNQRKSGFLAPSLGTSSDNGIEFSLPYYWNIAPNMDATITPRLITRRGLQLNNEFRYLNTAYGGLYQGKARAEFLLGDRLRDGDNRWGFSLLHSQSMANGFSGLINFNRVSDDNYYTDLSSAISSTAKTQLLQQGVLSYGGGGWWSATANFQQYQTLQPDTKVPVPRPYRMLPQITLNARQPDLYRTDSSFLGQYTAFSKLSQMINGVTVDDPDGQRTVLYPQVAVPYVTPAW
ncbi:MAG: LPS assembly protein LptD, partial [Propionivibrio sp.]